MFGKRIALALALALVTAAPVAAQETVTLSVTSHRVNGDGSVTLTLASGHEIKVVRGDIAGGTLVIVEPGTLPSRDEAVAIGADVCLVRYPADEASRTGCEAQITGAWQALVDRPMDTPNRAAVRALCGVQYPKDFTTWDFCERRSLDAVGRLDARVMDDPEEIAIREKCALEAPTDVAARDFCERRELDALAVLRAGQ